MEDKVLQRIKFNSGVNMLLCFSALREESANGPVAAALRSACHRGGTAEGEVTRPSRSFIQGVFARAGRRHCGSSRPASALRAIKSSEIFQVSFPNLWVPSNRQMFRNVQHFSVRHSRWVAPTVGHLQATKWSQRQVNSEGLWTPV